MRMRFKPYARPELAAWPHFADAPEQLKGRWRATFSAPDQPLCLELGCGKGFFLSSLALRQPQYNHLGVDIKSEVLVVAKRTCEQLYSTANTPITNIAFTSQNIEKISDILSPDDNVSRIYINFCNPWYKSGHAKHRLTHPRQLALYRDFLVPGGEIWFKTDDDALFEDSLRYFAYTGFAVTWSTRDLHQDEPSWNIRTEHETMFSQEDIPIKALIAKMHPAQLDRAAIARLKDL